MVMTQQATDPVTLGCYHGFGDMCRSDIVRIVALKGVECDVGGSFFQTVLSAIMGVLNMSERDALPLAAIRHCGNLNSQFCAQHLFNMDAAIEVVGPQDKQAYAEEQKQAINQGETMECFVFELAQRRQEVDAAKRPRTNPEPPRSQGFPGTLVNKLPNFGFFQTRTYGSPGPVTSGGDTWLHTGALLNLESPR